MARPLRIQYENAYYHVTCRGNAGQNIFIDDRDRQGFLGLLERSADIYQVHVLAFVLMANHFHLIVKTPLANLQEFMRHFNISYTAFFNKRHKRSGHLYQGRYKSFVIDADSYLLEVSRYVHLNPVRISARDRLSPGEKRKELRRYSWSSYPEYLSAKSRHPFLDTGDILTRFGGERRKYADFVESGVSEVVNPLEKGTGHGIVGERSFIERTMKGLRGSRKPRREQPAAKRAIKQIAPERILQIIIESFNLSRQDLFQKGRRSFPRNVAMDMLYRYGGMNQREIGDLMGVDYSSVSIARKRLGISREKDREISRQYDEIAKQISQE